jgi:hypothetical protein
MIVQIMAAASVNEVGSTSIQIQLDLDTKDWSADDYFKALLIKYGIKVEDYQKAVGIVQKGAVTETMKESDDRFDQSFLLLKNLIGANQYSQDNEKSEAAKKLLDKIDSYDSQLYKLGYAEEIFLALSMITELKSEKFSPYMANLPGVDDAFQMFEVNTNKLNELYKESSEDSIDKGSQKSPSALKNDLREMINIKLVPYLLSMKDKDPENYEEAYAMLAHEIEKCNIRVKTRLTRNKQEEEDDFSAE